MTEYIRVREPGWEITIPKSRLHETHEVLDKPALQPSGAPVPPKPVTPLGVSATGGRRKSGAKKAAAKATPSSGKSSGENGGQSVATTEGN
jgi:hypothetical protein